LFQAKQPPFGEAVKGYCFGEWIMLIKVQPLKKEVVDLYDNEGRETGYEVQITRDNERIVYINEAFVIAVSVTKDGAWIKIGDDSGYLVELQNPSLPFPENVRVVNEPFATPLEKTLEKAVAKAISHIPTRALFVGSCFIKRVSMGEVVVACDSEPLVNMLKQPTKLDALTKAIACVLRSPHNITLVVEKRAS
jgi:hypothetical protein